MRALLSRALGRFRKRVAREALPPRPSLAQDLAAAGTTLERWLAAFRSGPPRVYGSLDDDATRQLAAAQPAPAGRTVAAADAVLAHRFDLLGSGPFVPVDPERPVQDGYRPIDWYLDPVRGLRFPTGIPHKEWDYYAMRPGNADIKYPWELGRCQHWVTLGQAWQLTADERYAREVARQLDDFMEANPVGVGVNWTCTMDVGLRAVSWAIALTQVRGAGALDADFWERAANALFDHGAFIRGNLENHYEVTSNHFLSNVLGLHFLGAVFGDLAAGREWDAFARHALEQEVGVQVLADGADFESSVPYHRLVTELFLGAARLADHQQRPLSADYRRRLADMAAFLAGVLRPDGLMPQVGDADDGRLHIFTDYGSWNPQDSRHLFAPAARIADRPGLLASAGPDGSWEAAWWGLGGSAETVEPDGDADEAMALYPDAGIAVMRTSNAFLLVTNGVVGTEGFGNHKHNDLLSFEYHHRGRPLVVDPGSYVYTSDFAARNAFRSTAWHNTLRVDGEEQNEFKDEWLFRMFAKAAPVHRSTVETEAYFQYIGSHDGYERLAQGVLHVRGFRLLRDGGGLALCDLLRGTGEHRLEWSFSCAPGVTATAGDGECRLQGGSRDHVLRLPPGVVAEVVDGWYSPAYGRREPAQRIVCRAQARCEDSPHWTFLLCEAGDGEGRERLERTALDLAAEVAA